MRKFVTLAVLFAIGMIAAAQDATIPAVGGVAGTSTNLNAYGATARTYTWRYLGGDPYLYTVQLHLDDVSAASTANTATCVLAGSVDGTNYKTITSVSYAAGGTDTTIVYQITSAPLSYPFLRLTVTPSDSIKVASRWASIAPWGN